MKADTYRDRHTVPPSFVILTCTFFVGCTLSLRTQPSSVSVSGARSALPVTDTIISRAPAPEPPRKAATLGIFVSQYIAESAAAKGTESALLGIGVQTHVIDMQKNVSDPDFDLMQAFADALQVDVADLLNRNPDREKSLDLYAEALTNVATRANDRYKEVSSAADDLKKLNRNQESAKNAAQRDLDTALKNKQFTEASEKQKTLLEAQQAFAESDLKLRELNELIKTLDKLLTLYGQKILAIQQNREVLISGLKVVDVPGIEDLKIIQRKTGGGIGTARTNSNVFDPLFKQ